MKTKIVLFVIFALVVLSFAGGYLFAMKNGASDAGIVESVVVESSLTRRKLDERCDGIEKKLSALEGKIDRLIDLLSPKLPDGMKIAE